MRRRNFQKHLLSFLLLVACAAFSQAQDSKSKYRQHGKPDFSGTWELDALKSELNRKLLVVSGPTVALAIAHSEPDLRIIQTIDSGKFEKRLEFHYRTDGTGETNLPSRSFLALFNGSEMRNPGPSNIESKSEWKGSKLKTRSAFVIYLPQGKQTTVKVEEVLEMLSDGQTLIQTTSFKSDGGGPIHFNPGTMKKVFNRVS